MNEKVSVILTVAFVAALISAWTTSDHGTEHVEHVPGGDVLRQTEGTPFELDDEEDELVESNNATWGSWSMDSMLNAIGARDGPSNGNKGYVPGRLNTRCNGLLLSQGLECRLIAEKGKKVQYHDKKTSPKAFHKRPDGAAVVKRDGGNGWIYVSNSELDNGNGGVGAITFDKRGRVLKYEMILEGTSRNCQGGVTPWNSWISCEEIKNDGQCWETDPQGIKKATKTKLGGTGGNYEAVAVDDRNPDNLVFFVTEDFVGGGLRRVTPKASAIRNAYATGNHRKILRSAPQTREYLILEPTTEKRGTFRWTSSKAEAEANARVYYRKSEGMDIRNGTLFFVSSSQKNLFSLDLDGMTYRKTRTYSRQFKGEPDGLRRNRGVLYLAEEPRNTGTGAGIFMQDLDTGEFHTILETDTWRGDSTGIAFSPKRKHMYVAFQIDGVLFDIYRKDGKPLHGRGSDLEHL